MNELVCVGVTFVLFISTCVNIRVFVGVIVGKQSLHVLLRSTFTSYYFLLSLPVKTTLQVAAGFSGNSPEFTSYIL